MPSFFLLPTEGRHAQRCECHCGGEQTIAGAVAVIVSSPDHGQHVYKIRSIDGTEAMVRRNEFSSLKSI